MGPSEAEDQFDHGAWMEKKGPALSRVEVPALSERAQLSGDVNHELMEDAEGCVQPPL